MAKRGEKFRLADRRHCGERRRTQNTAQAEICAQRVLLLRDACGRRTRDGTLGDLGSGACGACQRHAQGSRQDLDGQHAEGCGGRETEQL